MTTITDPDPRQRVSLEEKITEIGKAIERRKFIEIGLRVPHQFFVTSGIGESDLTHHAGSYHDALIDARIAEFNHIDYSSILPGIAEDIGQKPEGLIHGSVMEGISAVANVRKGERGTAGIIYSWLINRQTRKRFGGLVCEYNGSKTEDEAREMLFGNLQELYTNGFSEKYVLEDPFLITRSIISKKEYGTALIRICFVNHKVPILSKPYHRKR